MARSRNLSISASRSASAAHVGGARRGGRRGEGDDEVSDAARHDLPSRPTRKTRGSVSRPAMIGNQLIAFGQLDQNRCGAISARQKGSGRRAQASSTAETNAGRRRRRVMGFFGKNNSWRLAACKTLGIPSLKVKKRQPKCPH